MQAYKLCLLHHVMTNPLAILMPLRKEDKKKHVTDTLKSDKGLLQSIQNNDSLQQLCDLNVKSTLSAISDQIGIVIVNWVKDQITDFLTYFPENTPAFSVDAMHNFIETREMFVFAVQVLLIVFDGLPTKLNLKNFWWVHSSCSELLNLLKI